METNVELYPMDKLDKKCKMLIDILKKDVELGYLTDDDGFGFYATNDKVSHIYINFYDIINNTYPSWATHVCWFNK